MPTKKATSRKESSSKKGKSKKTTSAKKTYSISGEHLASRKVKSSYISGATFGLKEVQYATVDGEAIFEGDIVLGSVAEMEAVKKNVEHPKPGLAASVIISGNQFRWPDGVIFFRIDSGLQNQQRVTDAIRHWEENTNVRFIQRTTQPDFVTFKAGGGCSSQVGRRGGEQFVTLGANCTTGNAIHEIGHTAGLWHEQSREDRDNFVTINFSNIQAGMAHNFNQQITDGDDIGPYDYDSIMHYPRNAFAINPNRDTVTPKPNPNVAIGQRERLSTGDLRAINSIYPKKTILGDTSSNGPALATKTNTILLGWTGVGNLRLNFMSSTDGLNYSNKVTLNETSPTAFALTVFQNKFVVAWIGIGNNSLNVMQSSNGLNWANKVTLNEASQSAPALAVLGNQLVIAWRGVGNNQINIMRSANGISWGNKITLGDTTASGPALATLGSRLLLGWRGAGNNQLNVMQSSNGSSFTGKVTLAETTVSKPGLHASGGRAVLTWQGIGNRFLNVLASNNGTTWTSKQTASQTCIDGPVISNLGNRLVWGWTGTDAAHRLNSMLFNVV